MAEVGPARSRRPTDGALATPASGIASWHGHKLRGGAAYPLLPKMWRRTLKIGSETGARPSTLRVVVAAIARNHKDAGFDVPVHHGVARTVLGRPDAG